MEQRSNYNKFLLLWSGELVSAIGSGLTSFGLGVYVFQKTGSAANMALVALLAFLPVLLLSAPAGVLADRYDRRILMMAGDGLSALGLVYILICMLSGEAKLHQICIGVFISSVFSSLLEPSYSDKGGILESGRHGEHRRQRKISYITAHSRHASDSE